jgi:hypothetical protein
VGVFKIGIFYRKERKKSSPSKWNKCYKFTPRPKVVKE